MIDHISGIHHITILTKSEKENNYFYTTILGLNLVIRTFHQENMKIPHLFYGDKNGNPGTLLSFFVFPRLGKSYRENNYYSTITLKIPEGSVKYWDNRLKKNGIDTEHDAEGSIIFRDPDSVCFRLKEFPILIDEENASVHSDVPRDKQISGIFAQEIRVQDTMKEQTFIEELFQLNGKPLSDKKHSFELLLMPSKSNSRTRHGRGSIDHIALTAEKQGTLHRLKERALTLGYEVELFKDRDFFLCLYVKDPFGLRFEIATRGPGFNEYDRKK